MNLKKNISHKLEIKTVPNPILRKKSKSIKKIDSEIKNLAQAMVAKLSGEKEVKGQEERENKEKSKKEKKESENKRIGVGLSAVQVGYLKRLFVVWDPKTKKDFVFINPRITWRSKKQIKEIPEVENKHEGCLSVPGFWGLVKRPVAIKIKYQDLDNQKQKQTFKGFLARVIQHEFDHLDGILFVDRLLKQKEKIYKAEENEQGEAVLTEARL